jgi:hypothetical protein
MLATELLQRARQADPRSGLWEAADVQWWWRKPRRSDGIERLFWVDSQGPVAGVLLTSWTDEDWQCDPIIVPRVPGPEPKVVWAQALQEIGAHAVGRIEVPVRDDDLAFKELVEGSGLVVGERTSTAWMSAADRPHVQSPAEGFALVDRTQREAHRIRCVTETATPSKNALLSARSTIPNSTSLWRQPTGESPDTRSIGSTR